VRRSPAPAARGAAILAAALILAVASWPVSAAPVRAPTAAAHRRAILVSGADRARGLPFFEPNAIAALSGRYALDAAAQAGAGAPATVAVWFSRESLVFGPAWKRVDAREAGTYAEAAYSLPRDVGAVLALKFEGYALFFELSGDPRAAAFSRAFSAKFPVFFRNAPSDAELSFPAYVDY
jgi:hypothetical protein